MFNWKNRVLKDKEYFNLLISGKFNGNNLIMSIVKIIIQELSNKKADMNTFSLILTV